MTVADLLPWANLLLFPMVALLFKITNQLATLTAVQGEHSRRLQNLERQQA